MRLRQHDTNYKNNLVSALQWKQKLFTAPQDYNRMIGAIRRDRFEWQYFNGLAFTGNPAINTQNAFEDIKSEMKNAMENISTIMGKNSNELSKQLDRKIKEYEDKELTLYNTLIGKLEGWTPTIRLSPGMSIQQKADCWRNLFIGPIVNQLNNNSGQAITINDENDALYCFLMSKEMYEEIKNSPALRTRLSREDWERGFYPNNTGKSKYSYGEGSKEMKKLEEEFAKAFFGSRKSSKSLNSLIYNAFEIAIQQNSFAVQNKDKYLKIIDTSYKEMRKKAESTGLSDYTLLHDKLKKWGADTLTEINLLIKQDFKKIKETGVTEILEIERVEVKQNQVTFFTITGQNFEQIAGKKKSEEVAGEIVQTIRSLIQRFFNEKVEKEKDFYLTILGFGKRFLMSPDTALSAAAGWEKVNTQQVYESIRSYLNKNGGKGIKSNSVISGFLGELAIYFSSRFKVTKQLTGNLQQRYRYGQAKKRVTENQKIASYSDKAIIGDLEKRRIEPTSGNSLSPAQEKWNKRRERYEKSFKGTGQFFSDMQLVDDMEILTGINIKRYVENNNTFKLTTLQTKGLKLDHANLRRYMTEKEIILLNYLQSNYSIMKDFKETYNVEPINIEEAAQAFMNNNASSIIRITSAGFDTTNYIIAANGYFIPASAVFQYLKQQIEKENFKLFEVKNAISLPYQTIEYDNNGQLAHPENKLNVAQLRYTEMTKNASSLMFRFNEFSVQIKQLLAL